jgi:hypothetical protein
MTTTNSKQISGSGRLSNVLAALEANIAKSSGSESLNITNVATSRRGRRTKAGEKEGSTPETAPSRGRKSVNIEADDDKVTSSSQHSRRRRASSVPRSRIPKLANLFNRKFSSTNDPPPMTPPASPVGKLTSRLAPMFPASPLPPPPVSPGRVNTAPFEAPQTPTKGTPKFVKGEPSSPLRVLRRLFQRRPSCGPGTSNTSVTRREEELLKYDYDYKGVRNTWTNRTQEAVEQQKEQNRWNPLRLRRRRQQVQEPAISKMPRRGSTGKLAAVDSSHSMTSRNYRENRRGGRRNSKSIKADNNKKVPLRSQKLIRRASTGAVRLAEEPVVTIFWNPAREETLASSMHEDPAEAIQ